MTISDKELAAMPAKTKKIPEVVELYQTWPFLEAYARHTDLRVLDNPRGAVGNPLDWERYGKIQHDFLVSRGMLPRHSLLDIGCGTGRLARLAVPYLDEDRYTGVDLSVSAIEYAKRLSVVEGWDHRRPTFIVSDSMEVSGQFDYVWAFSVIIHLPCDVVERMFAKVATFMHERSKFLFSFVPEKIEQRTGLKQFRHVMQFHLDALNAAGLTFKQVPWPGAQKIALATLK